jgi:hypothetical protein
VPVLGRKRCERMRASPFGMGRSACDIDITFDNAIIESFLRIVKRYFAFPCFRNERNRWIRARSCVILNTVPMRPASAL